MHRRGSAGAVGDLPAHGRAKCRTLKPYSLDEVPPPELTYLGKGCGEWHRLGWDYGTGMCAMEAAITNRGA